MKSYRLDHLVAGIILTLFLGKVGEVIQTFGYSITLIDIGVGALYLLLAAYLVFLVADAKWRLAGTVLTGLVVIAYAFLAATRTISFSSLDMAPEAKVRVVVGMATTSLVIWSLLLAYFIKRLTAR